MTKYIERPEILKEINLNHHTMIEASAGTGKTYTLEHLVVEIILQEKASIREILLLTFTEKAVEELRTRVKKVLTDIIQKNPEENAPENIDGYWQIGEHEENLVRRALADFDQATIVTIHSFCRKLLNDYPIYTRQPLSTTLIDDEKYIRDALFTVLTRMQQQDNADYDLFAQALETVQDTGKYLQNLADTMGRVFSAQAPIHPSCYQTEGCSIHARLIQAIKQQVERQLEDYKRQKGLISFDDLLKNVKDSLLDSESGNNFADELATAFPICIIDEFQDTDPTQWAIFEKIYLSEDRGVLFMVGDPKQAIYAFRGAEVRSYLQAKQRLQAIHDEKGTADILNLRKNFRSTKNILNIFNTIFCDPTNNFFSSGITAQTLECGSPEFNIFCNRQPQPTEAPAMTVLYVNENDALNDPLKHFKIKKSKDNKDKANIAKGTFSELYQNYLAYFLKRLLSNPPTIELKKGKRPVGPQDIFLLAQTNNELLSMATFLEKWHIPYNFYKEDGLFQQQEAKDIADLLCAIANPYDEKLRLRALLGPFFDIKLTDLARFQALPGTHPIMVQLTIWQQLAERHDFTRLFNSLLTDSKLSCRQLYAQDSLRSLNSYQRIFDILTVTAADSSYELNDIIEILYQYIENKRTNPDADDGKHQQQFSQAAVQLLTMHKSKGLEAPIVAICGALSTGQIMTDIPVSIFYEDDRRYIYVGKPDEHYATLINENRCSEAQRLLYVALTRASHHLIIPAWYDTDPSGTLHKSAMATVNGQLQTIYGTIPPQQNQENITFLSCLDQKAPQKYKNNGLQTQPLDNITFKDSEENISGELVSPIAALTALEEAKTIFHGPYISSYSRIKRLSGHDYSLEEAEETDMQLASPAENGLPGGTTFGSMIHKILEELDFSTIKPDQPLEAWLADEEIHRFLAEKCRQFDFSETLLPAIADLIHHTLEKELLLADGQKLPALRTATAKQREMEFYFPVPNDTAARLTAFEPQWQVERGFIKGYLDMLFSYDGQKFYVVDWKSDLLPAYNREAVARHVTGNYDIQASLYSLTLAKLLNIHTKEDYDNRFGGLLYIFVRATQTGEGCYFYRCSYEDLQQEYQKLASRQLGQEND